MEMMALGDTSWRSPLAPADAKTALTGEPRERIVALRIEIFPAHAWRSYAAPSRRASINKNILIHMRLLHLFVLVLSIAAMLPVESSGQAPMWRYAGKLPSRDNWVIAADSRGVVYVGGLDGSGSSYPGLFMHHNLSWGVSDTIFERVVYAEGGAIFSMAVDSNDHLFVGTYEGVTRTADSGRTWQFTTDTFFHSQVFDLAVNARGDLFAATYRFGFYRSTDNGVTWRTSNGGLEVAPASALAVDRDGVLYGGMFNGGLFRSTDNGDTWERGNRRWERGNRRWERGNRR